MQARDPAFERLLQSTQQLASQIKHEHQAPNHGWQSQQAQWQQAQWQQQQWQKQQWQQWQQAAPAQTQQTAWHLQQPRQQLPQHAQQGFLGFVDNGHPSSHYTSNDDASGRSASLDSMFLGGVSLDSDLATSCLDELLADGLFDERQGGPNPQHGNQKSDNDQPRH